MSKVCDIKASEITIGQYNIIRKAKISHLKIPTTFVIHKSSNKTNSHKKLTPGVEGATVYQDKTLRI